MCSFRNRIILLILFGNHKQGNFNDAKISLFGKNTKSKPNIYIYKFFLQEE
jgi:hypothetical protein